MIAEEVDDEKAKGNAAAAGNRLSGRPARSTDVHNVHKLTPGRPTESTQLSVRHPVDRPVDRWKGSVDRPVDRQAGRAAICRFENLLYLRAVVGF